jgi:hypothetical protein
MGLKEAEYRDVTLTVFDVGYSLDPTNGDGSIIITLVAQKSLIRGEGYLTEKELPLLEWEDHTTEVNTLSQKLLRVARKRVFNQARKKQRGATYRASLNKLLIRIVDRSRVTPAAQPSSAIGRSALRAAGGY